MKFVGEPVPGFYRVRLVRGGLFVGVRIWFGQPIIDGEVQDRSPRLCVEVDGKTDRIEYDDGGAQIGHTPLDVHEVWPFVTPITEREFDFLARRRTWATDHDPDHPAANARKPVDLRTLKPGW